MLKEMQIFNRIIGYDCKDNSAEIMAKDVAVKLMQAGDPDLIGGILADRYEHLKPYIAFFVGLGCKWDNHRILLPSGNRILLSIFNSFAGWRSIDFFILGIDEANAPPSETELPIDIARTRLHNTPHSSPIFR